MEKIDKNVKYREKSRIKKKIAADEAKKLGNCTVHNNVKAHLGCTLCDYCLEIRRNRKNSLRNQGKCTTHGDRDAVSGRKACQECIDANKERARIRVANGFCQNHPDRPLKGKIQCDECMERRNWARIQRLYGISKEQYFVECEKRNYQCDICKITCKPAGSDCKLGEMFQIDHDHSTNRVRGLLCLPCNMYLGQFYEDRDRLQNVMDNLFNYLDGKDNI